MKDLIILTDLPIFYDSIATKIKTKFKNYNILSDTSNYIYLKKHGRGFEIEISPNDRLNDPITMMDDTIRLCPNKEAFLTNLSYTSYNIAKEIIALIIHDYGNMWIQSDEDDDWFGTAQEFIDNYQNK